MYSILKPDYVYRDISEDIADNDDDYDAEEFEKLEDEAIEGAVGIAGGAAVNDIEGLTIPLTAITVSASKAG